MKIIENTQTVSGHFTAVFLWTDHRATHVWLTDIEIGVGQGMGSDASWESELAGAGSGSVWIKGLGLRITQPTTRIYMQSLTVLDSKCVKCNCSVIQWPAALSTIRHVLFQGNLSDVRDESWSSQCLGSKGLDILPGNIRRSSTVLGWLRIMGAFYGHGLSDTKDPRSTANHWMTLDDCTAAWSWWPAGGRQNSDTRDTFKKFKRLGWQAHATWSL